MEEGEEKLADVDAAAPAVDVEGIEIRVGVKTGNGTGRESECRVGREVEEE